MPDLITEESGVLSLEEYDDYIRYKIDQFTRKMVLDLFYLLVVWTPVDTGRARAGWSIGKNNPPSQVPQEDLEYYPEPQPPSIVLRPNSLGLWFIVNNVSYIEVLDDGRGFRHGQMRGSEQAPNGMVTLALQELERSLGE